MSTRKAISLRPKSWPYNEIDNLAPRVADENFAGLRGELQSRDRISRNTLKSFSDNAGMLAPRNSQEITGRSDLVVAGFHLEDWPAMAKFPRAVAVKALLRQA